MKQPLFSLENCWLEGGDLEETLHRAINLRLLDKADLCALQLEWLESQGFLLIKTIDQALKVYEQSDQPFE